MIKKHITYHLSLIMILALTLTSCERDADIDLPHVEPMLVLGGFISPDDDSVMITISKSDPIFDGKSIDADVNDVTLNISDGTTQKAMTLKENRFSGNSYFYISKSEFPIIPGKTYAINAESAGGLKASAECTTSLTEHVDIDSVIVDNTVHSDNYYTETKYNLIISFDDPAEKNYYRLYAQAVFRDSQGNIYYRNFNYDIHEYVLIDDKNSNGQRITSKLSFINYTTTGYPSELIGFDVYLLNIDEEYHKYYKSLDRVVFGEDPFSEPTLVYTNIKNGLGIFCSFRESKKSMRF